MHTRVARSATHDKTGVAAGRTIPRRHTYDSIEPTNGAQPAFFAKHLGTRSRCSIRRMRRGSTPTRTATKSRGYLRQLARHWLANGLTRLQAAWKLAERTGLEPVTCATLCSEAQPIESVGALAQAGTRWQTSSL